MSLYCIVSDDPLNPRTETQRTLAETLKQLGATHINKGPTEYSIEFRIDVDEWAETRWKHWHFSIDQMQAVYGFSIEKSCLPKGFHSFYLDTNVVSCRIDSKEDWRRVVRKLERAHYPLNRLGKVQALRNTEAHDLCPSFGLTRNHKGDLIFEDWLKSNHMDEYLAVITKAHSECI